jgi:Fe-S cluster assembly protein SufD
MVIGDGHQTIDNTTRIIHQESDCNSNELFKYILNEQSTGVFNGMLKVMPDAQKTAANQTNRNILLTESAHIHTQPQLEIYADDVKCSHGATTGQLDEQALFYMQQRGIAQKEAKLLLMTAFVNDVIENIHISSLQDKIRLLVDKRLRGEENKCQTCKACH